MYRILETPRLILRQWNESDFEPFYKMNADSKVMEYFPKTLTEDESNQLAFKCKSLIDKNGWGFWALELKQSKEFIGFTGLHYQPEQFSFSPCTEIGWRLSPLHWNKGYATESATACLNFGFNQLALDEIVAFTAQHNLKSQAVMRRLGMQYKMDFNHPALDDSSPLKKHKLLSLLKTDFKLLL